MGDEEYEKLEDSLISIASELFRFQKVFEKAIGKLDADEQSKYMSQYAWFSKRVNKAMESAKLRLVNLEGQLFDAGMAIKPLNIEDFASDDALYVYQMMEPIVMKEDTVVKTGTALLGRLER